MINMQIKNPSILIVDDEKAIVKMIETVLRKEGFTQLHTAYTAEEALSLVQTKPITIIILDVMLPDYSGFELCPRLRDISSAYILFLTARISDLDKLTGFAIGADDYITKPFNPLEVVARIKAYLRRAAYETLSISQTTQYEYDQFTVNEQAGEVRVKGKVVNCPAQVYHLLLHFCQHPNQVFSKEQLLDSVWGEDQFYDDNTVMVHIRRVRELIEIDPSNPSTIITIRGLGYKLVEDKKQ